MSSQAEPRGRCPRAQHISQSTSPRHLGGQFLTKKALSARLPPDITNFGGYNSSSLVPPYVPRKSSFPSQISLHTISLLFLRAFSWLWGSLTASLPAPHRPQQPRGPWSSQVGSSWGRCAEQVWAAEPISMVHSKGRQPAKSHRWCLACSAKSCRFPVPLSNEESRSCRARDLMAIWGIPALPSTSDKSLNSMKHLSGNGWERAVRLNAVVCAKFISGL